MAKQARLFTSGGSQAVRLPAEFRFKSTDAVFVRRNAAGEVVLSERRPGSYQAFLTARAEQGDIPEGFLSDSERAQRTETRDPFAADGDETA